MKKRTVIGAITAGVLLVGAIGSGYDKQPSSLDNTSGTQNTSVTTEPTEKVKPTCDGTTVTSDCSLKGKDYKTYIYYPAVKKKTHVETVTSYKKEVTGYCTLCNDGTYSPSCATGRGACSWHGGVAEWNAPRYSNVPVYKKKTIVDSPAKKAYYEKILE